MKVYSPTATARHMRCPMAQHLYREGWRLRRQGYLEAAGMTGKGVATGLAVYNNLLRTHQQHHGVGSPWITDDNRKAWIAVGWGVAEAAMQTEFEAMEALPLILPEDWAKTKDMAYKRVKMVLDQYGHDHPLDQEIVAVEEELSDSGRSRPDLVIRENGLLYVVDYKTTSSISRFNMMERMYADSFQLKHYAYFLQEKHQMPVAGYWICALSTTQLIAKLLKYSLDPELIKLWYEATKPAWKQMEDVETGAADPWMSANHTTPWGDCEYKRACVNFRLDTALMRADYIQVERVREEDEV